MAGVGVGVEAGEGVEHRAAGGGVDAGGVVEEEHGVALRAKGDAVVAAGEKACAPHAREEGLRGGFRGPLWREDDEGGEIVVLAAEAVGEPGTEAGFAGELAAGHEERAGGVVVDGVGVDGADDGEVIDELGGPREEFADPGAVLAVLGEFENRRRDGEFRLAAGHRGDALAGADGVGELDVELGGEPRFVVEGVELRRPAVHVEVDDALGGGREMRQAGERRVDAGLGGVKS